MQMWEKLVIVVFAGAALYILYSLVKDLTAPAKVPKHPQHIQNVLDVFESPVDFQKCCGAAKADEITAFEILAHLT